jgi:hypothetical protein
VTRLQLRGLAVAFLLGAATAAGASAQSVFPSDNGAAVFPVNNGEILAGVTAVDAQVLVLNWLEMGPALNEFKDAAQTAFRSAVRTLGVVPDGNANFLFCELKVVGIGRAAVVYSWSLGYYEYVVGGAHHLQWTTGGIVRVGRTNFSPAAAVEECAAGFKLEWSRWNQPAGERQVPAQGAGKTRG